MVTPRGKSLSVALSRELDAFHILSGISDADWPDEKKQSGEVSVGTGTNDNVLDVGGYCHQKHPSKNIINCCI